MQRAIAYGKDPLFGSVDGGGVAAAAIYRVE